MLVVYNGILMETIGIPVMVSIGLLLFFFTGFALIKGCNVRVTFLWIFFEALFEHLHEIFEHAFKLLSIKLSFKILTSLVMLLF